MKSDTRHDSSQVAKKVAPAYHAAGLSELFETIETSAAGLSEAEARRRLSKFGPNELPHKPPPAWWQILLNQFSSPLIYILALAAMVSLAIGELTDAVFIAGVLFVNALIGGYQEWKAERSTRALQKLLQIRAAVVRDGEVCEINAEAVVPGDVVCLESGNRVPADVRLLSVHGLEVDESLLTGESLPVFKDPLAEIAAETSVADRVNMAHAGSIVARGRGQGIVIATGTRTVVGQLAQDVLGGMEGKPPLIERMEWFARVIAYATLAAAAVVAGLGIALRGYSLIEMFMFGVALVVSAIPEGLPVAMTVALAVATIRMARRGVIVRRLAAVEGLGSCTLIASDKTGTLTRNELTVREIRLPLGDETFTVTGVGFAPDGEVLRDGKPVDVRLCDALNSLASVAVLCNEADLHRRDSNWIWRGDPTDIALLAMAHKLGWKREPTLDEFPQINQIPFEPERQYSATYHQVKDAVRVFVKGAPERVIAMCEEATDTAKARELLTKAEEMAERGYRVLAFAEGEAQAGFNTSVAPPEPAGLSFVGFVGMIDPLREGAAEAVEACHRAGITVCMVTGDHPVTALAIAGELGLAGDRSQVITGAEIEGKSTEEFQAIVERVRVFARVAPHQKLQIVRAAQAAGHFVAVTGDGVNDAPALRAANIGVAMGREGTDVAREAAELVISDDNFATIVAGVEEGRVAYDNVRKVIYLLVSTGAAEVLMIGLTIISGLPLPLLPVQLLWLNLVTNGIQGVALAFEPGEGDSLRKSPRPPRESIFNRLMNERMVIGVAVMGGVTFGAFWWLLSAGWSESSARNAVLLLMVLFENIHIGNSRSETKSALRLSPLKSPMLLAGALSALGLHIAAVYTPIGQRVLQTEPVGIYMWIGLFALALTVFVAIEIHKITWAHRRARQRQGA